MLSSSQDPLFLRSDPVDEAELAAVAANAVELTPDLAGHLRHCSHCRAALVQLQETAAVQIRAAANLPKPTLHPHLDSWFSKHLAHPSESEFWMNRKPKGIRFQPLALCAAATFLALAALFIVSRQFHRARLAEPFPMPESIEPGRGSPDLPAPTWLAFRRELASNTNSEELPFNAAGSTATHYWLRDAHFYADSLTTDMD